MADYLIRLCAIVDSVIALSVADEADAEAQGLAVVRHDLQALKWELELQRDRGGS